MGRHDIDGRRGVPRARGAGRGLAVAAATVVVTALSVVAPPLASGLATVLAPAAVTQVAAVAATATVTADPVIAVAGDNACGASSPGAACREMATSDLLLTMQADDRLDAVIPLGDVQYECGELENFMLADASNPPRGYDRSWGRVKGITTPVIGNHEYLTDPTSCLPQAAGAPGYFGYFGHAASPLEQGCAASCKAYYSYDLGGWHVVVLNSNCGMVPSGGCGATGAQAQWLRADLAATGKQCIAAAFHHPRYSSSTRASSATQSLWQILYDGGADVVLTGHEHSYERFDKLGRTPSATDAFEPVVDPNGMREFVVGTGGRNVSTFAGPIRTGSQVRNDTTFGVLRMVLHDSSYDWNFVPQQGQTFTDAGSTPCRGTTPDVEAPTVPTGLTATPSSTSVALSWSPSTDAVGVTGYEVWRNGAFLASVAAPTTTYTDAAVTAGVAYSYQVLARDAAGNTSALSAAVSATVPAPLPPGTFAPVADARVEEGAPNNNYATTLLRSDGGADPDVESYLRFSVEGLTAPVQRAVLRLYCSNGSADGPGMFVTSGTWNETSLTWNTRPARSTTPFVDKGPISGGGFVEYDVTPAVTGNGTYDWVFAGTSSDGTDFSSREMANPPQLVVTTATSTPDTTSPSVPTGLSATASGATRVDLAWLASTDDVGVTGYEVWRDGALLSTVAAPATSQADLTVQPATTYGYQVRARDAAGNFSALSTSVPVTTPAAPTGSSTVVVLPDADARVSQARPTGNYATSYLRSDKGTNADVESYLRFPVTGLTGTVTSARLKVYVVSGSVDGPGVYATSNAWTESTLTWSNRPARASTPVADVLKATTGTWLEYDVTSLVSGNGSVSMVLATGSTDGTDMGARESTTPASLTITTTAP